MLWAIVVLFFASFAIGAGNLLFTNSQVHNVRNTQEQANANSAALARANAALRKQILADCGFNRDLAGLPVTAMPGQHPSKLGVRIVLDARSSWYGHGCPGALPALDPTVSAGAAYYHLPVPKPPPG